MERRKFVNLLLGGTGAIFLSYDSFAGFGQNRDSGLSLDLNQLLRDAREKFLEGDFASASAIYFDALDIDSSLIQIYDGLKKSLFAEKKSDEFLELIRKGWRENPGIASFSDRLARSLVIAGTGDYVLSQYYIKNYGDQNLLSIAKDLYLDAIEKFPNNSELKYGLEDLLVQNSKLINRKNKKKLILLPEVEIDQVQKIVSVFDLKRPVDNKNLSIQDLQLKVRDLRIKLKKNPEVLVLKKQFKRSAHDLLKKKIAENRWDLVEETALAILEVEEDFTALKAIKRTYFKENRYRDLLAVYNQFVNEKSFSHKMFKAKLIRLAYKKDQIGKERLEKSLERLEKLYLEEQDMSFTQQFFLIDNLIKTRVQLNQKEKLKREIRDRIQNLLQEERISNRLIILYTILFSYTLKQEGKSSRAIKVLEKLVGDIDIQDSESLVNDFIARLTEDIKPTALIPARKRLAKLYVLEGKRSKAIKQCQKIEEISPKDLFTQKFKERI